MGCIDEDISEHCLVCNQLRNEETQSLDVTYEDIFSEDIARQAAAVQLIASLLQRREDASASTTGPGCSPAEDSNSSQTVNV